MTSDHTGDWASENTARRAAEHTRVLSPSDRLILDSADGGWMVVGGKVNVFTTRRGPAGLGRLRPLFSAGPGQLLLGAPSSVGGQVLVCVGAGDAVISSTSLSDLTELVRAGQPEAVAELVEQWVTAVLGSIDDEHLHPIGERRNALLLGQRREVFAGDVIPVGLGGLWLNLAAPMSMWGQPMSGAVPLQAGSSVVFGDDGHVEVVTGVEALTTERGWEGVSRVLHAALVWLDETTERELERERRRSLDLSTFEDKLSVAIEQDVFDTVAGHGADRSRSLLSTPLLAALEVVAREAGVVFDPPPAARLSRSKEPLEVCARFSGFGYRKVGLGARWYETNSGPLLAYSDRGNGAWFALRWRGGRYVAVDARDGSVRSLDDDLDREITQAYQLYARLPQPSAHRLARFSLHRGHAALLWGTAVLLLVGALSLTPIMVIYFMRGLGLLGSGGVEFWTLACSLLLSWGGQFALSLFAVSLLVKADLSVRERLLTALFHHVIGLPLSAFRRQDSAGIAGRLDAAARMIAPASDVVALSATGTAMVAAGTVSLVLIDAYAGAMTMAACAALTVMIVACAWLGLRSRQRFEDVAAEFERVSTALIGSVSKIRVAGAERRASLKWAQAYAALQGARRSARLPIIAKDSLATAIVPVTAGVFVASVRTRGDVITPIGMAAFGTALLALLIGVCVLVGAIDATVEVVALAGRMRPLTQMPSGWRLGVVPGLPVHGNVAVTSLSYRAGSHAATVINDVSFTVASGEMVAIVGPSGCGKSTLLRLLLGFDEPTSGSIAFDGRDIASMDCGDLRAQCGVVVQSSRLTHGTLRENVVGSRPVTEADAMAALEAVGLGEYVASLPMGLDTLVSDHSGVMSGGQKQLLMLARAFAGNPRMLFLDEATSALDNRAQARVMQRIEELKVTRIVIAHRLSTVRRADRILVMDGGRLVQEGTYAQLVRMPGLFADLVANQDV